MRNIKRCLMLFFLLVICVFSLPSVVLAKDVSATYDGEYSLDYLLRNYNAVTFGMNDNNHIDFINYNVGDYSEYIGDINLMVEGPVLIKGNFFNDYISDIGLEYSILDTDVVSFIKGTRADYVSTPSKTATNKDFMNFTKLYNQIVKESNALVDKTDYHINEKNIHLSKPGIYQINSTRQASLMYSGYATPYTCSEYLDCYPTKYIYIDNYDPNGYYIFNNMKLYELDNYVVFVKKKGESKFTALENYIYNEGGYTGNIIFNYPNAIFIWAASQSGKIIAPKADILLENVELYGDYSSSIDYFEYHDSIFANTIIAVSDYNYVPFMGFTPYTSSKKITFKDGELKDIKEVSDYPDDIYTGTYSIEEMLKNYSVVTLGQKEYGEQTKFYQHGEYSNGSASIFHIVGQFLINGDIESYRKDLESYRINESSFSGYPVEYRDNFGYDYYETDYFAYKRWGDGDPEIGTNSNVYYYSEYEQLNDDRLMYTNKPFINYERLYTNIVEEQEGIMLGDKVEVKDRVAHIEIGRNYYIENINDIDEIVFDNFSNNSDMLTVITVLNNSDVNFPVISQTKLNNPISTKDFFGKKNALFSYEYYNFPDDIYYGNIIWNLPDATYIKLADNAPFTGHIVAPNADLETPETHFSGGFIVNSLYAEGNTEAHFYPLQVTDIPEDYNCLRVGANLNRPAGGGDGTKNPETATGYQVLLVILVIIAINVAVIKFIHIKDKLED